MFYHFTRLMHHLKTLKFIFYLEEIFFPVLQYDILLLIYCIYVQFY